MISKLWRESPYLLAKSSILKTLLMLLFLSETTLKG